MQKHILLLGITLLIGSIYLINQDNQSVEVNETLDQTLRFQRFKAKFGKRYGPSEDTYRFAVFTENMMQADIHNAKPESTYTMGETQFADLKKQEFVDIYLKKTDKNTVSQNPDDYDQPIFVGPKKYPAAFDWRKYPGVSSKVKSQGMCGSCWAFSAVSQIEAYFAIKKGILNLDLSEQQFVDCLYNGYGCYGGRAVAGLEFSMRYGVTTQDVYPYTGEDGDGCQIQTGPYQVNAVRQVLINDVEALKSAVSVQPVTAMVTSENWYLYTGGIFDYCDHGYRWEIDHDAIVVGYDANSWILKNSWGPDWGENGYIRLATGNCCNVLTWNYLAI